MWYAKDTQKKSLALTASSTDYFHIMIKVTYQRF